MTAQPLYTIEILRLAASLRPLNEALGPVDGAANLRSPTCGSRLTVFVTLGEDGKIAALTQEVHACAFGQAAAALVEQSAIGRTRAEIAAALDQLTDWLSGASDDPGQWPGLSALVPARSRTGRHGAILLPFRALLAALSPVG